MSVAHRSARPLARASVSLSIVAIASALLGWIAFAVAIALGNHFNTPDPRSGVLLLAWVGLGAVAVATWATACATAGVAWSRARAGNESGAATVALVMAVVAPCTWVLGWALLVVWFGFEALRGPWLFAFVLGFAGAVAMRGRD